MNFLFKKAMKDKDKATIAGGISGASSGSSLGWNAGLIADMVDDKNRDIKFKHIGGALTGLGSGVLGGLGKRKGFEDGDVTLQEAIDTAKIDSAGLAGSVVGANLGRQPVRSKDDKTKLVSSLAGSTLGNIGARETARRMINKKDK